MSIATKAQPVRVAETDAHEGPVYVADEHALYFTTLPTAGERPVVDIKRLDLETGRDLGRPPRRERRQRDGA